MLINAKDMYKKFNFQNAIILILSYLFICQHKFLSEFPEFHELFIQVSLVLAY